MKKIFACLLIALAASSVGSLRAQDCRVQYFDCDGPGASASMIRNCFDSNGKLTTQDIWWCNGDHSTYDYTTGHFQHKIAYVAQTQSSLLGVGPLSGHMNFIREART